MLAHAQRQFLVFANKTTLAVAGACGHVSAYGLLGGCAHALLSMWVHAYLFSAICNEHWALISFGDICVPACHCSCGYTLTIPPPHTLSYCPRTKHPPCPLPQLKTIGWDSHPPHTRPRTLTTPLHATTLHSHLLPAHTPAPHIHLSFGYKLPVTAPTPGLVPTVAKDRATLHIHSTHSINTHKHPTPTRLGKVYKGALVVPLSSPHQRAFVCGACIGTAQVGVSLVSLFDPLFKRSRLHCFDVCLT